MPDPRAQDRQSARACERTDSYSLLHPSARIKCCLPTGHDGPCDWHPAYQPRPEIRDVMDGEGPYGWEGND